LLLLLLLLLLLVVVVMVVSLLLLQFHSILQLKLLLLLLYIRLLLLGMLLPAPGQLWVLWVCRHACKQWMLLLLLVGLLPVLPASDSPLRLPCHRQLSITRSVLLLAIMLLLIGCLKRIIYNRRYLLYCLIAAILAAVNPNRRHICDSCCAAGPSTLAGSIRCTPFLAGPCLHATTILSDSCHWLLLCSLCMLRNDWADN